MAQRAALKPRLQDIMTRVTALTDKPAMELLPTLFVEFEDELIDIARESAQLPEDIEWNDLDWEDGAALVQAVWETSILRPDGGGMLGKLMGLAKIGATIVPKTGGLSQPTKSGVPTPSDSHSSPDVGEATQNGSGTH